jgi:hypothetical protein
MERFKLRFKRNVLNLYFLRIPRVLNAYSTCFKRVSCALFTREERVFICRLKILGARFRGHLNDALISL